MCKRYTGMIVVTMLAALLTGCRSATPTTMSVPPTHTPPMATLVPSSTVPATSVSTLGTPTSVSPTLISAPTEPSLAAEIEVSAPQVLAGHSGAVSSLGFSPDGALLASTGQDNTIRLWDIATGEAVQVLQGGSHTVKGVDFSPDGNLLAAIEPNQMIALWDLSTGRIMRQIGSPELQTCGLEFSPDGTLLVSGHVDTLVRLWDVESGELVRTLSGMEGLTCPVAFSPDGALVASGGGNTDSRILIWEVASGQLRHTLVGHAPNVYRIVFSPDGTLLASASGDRTAKLWDVTNGQLLHSLDADQYKLMYVAFSPDGQLLASGGDDSKVRLWDVESGDLLHTLRGHSREIYTVAFSPVDWLLASAGEGGDVLLWRISSTVASSSTAPESSSPSPGSGEDLIAFVSDRDGNGEIYVMNVADALQGTDGSNQRRLTQFRGFDGVPTWSPDGKQLAFYTHLSHSKWAIQVMDADGSNQRPLTDNDACDGAPFWSPDGARIAFTSAFDCDPDNREIVVMNADGSNQVKLTDNDVDDYLSAWSPDSQKIAFVSDRDGNDEIYTMNADGDEQSSRNPQRLTFDDAHDHMPAWSPDGAQIAFASNRDGNDEIYVMDADGGNLQRLTDNDADEWFPSWSPDGTQLLFNSNRDGGDLDVYVMNVDGTNVRRLTDSPGQDFNAVWQPFPPDEQGSRDAVDTWVRTYEGDPVWAALDGLVTDDGGYLLIGSTNYSHRNTRQEDVYLVKTDASGEIVWARAYGGDDFDRGNAVVQAGDGGFVILGETESSGAGDWDMLLLKVDADGNELWSKTFGGPAQERGNAIRRTADGGAILVGSTKSFGAGGTDLYLVRTDDLGNEVWSTTYGGELEEEGYDAHYTEDGGLFVLAQALRSARLYTDQNPDVFLLRTDGAGNEIWSQVWEEENVEGGHALLPTSGGNYIIVGITGSAGSQSDIDFLFLEIDADGNLIWDEPISDESAVDYGTDVIETHDGGYLITGMFSGGGHGAIPLIKTNQSGQVLWSRNLIEGPGNKAGMRVLSVPDGGFVIVGNTDEYHRGFETVLIKTDSTGNVME